MKPYDFFETTADTGIIARGETLAQAFSNASLAMFQVMCQVENVKPILSFPVHIKSENLDELLMDYLTELLALKDIHGIMLGQFELNMDQDNLTIEGNVWGEETRDEHQIKTEVKAVTYHKMEIKKNHGWELKFIVDI